MYVNAIELITITFDGWDKSRNMKIHHLASNAFNRHAKYYETVWRKCIESFLEIVQQS